MLITPLELEVKLTLPLYVGVTYPLPVLELKGPTLVLLFVKGGRV